MAGRIITARHGRPNLSRDCRISAQEYGDWWRQYDESGLHPDEAPPAALIDHAKNAQVVLSSTLPRAVETARHVLSGAGRDHEAPADPMYVEAPLPPPPVPLLRLRPGTWGVVSRAFWFWGYTPTGIESHRQSWSRVRRVADQLAEHARDGDVLLCAHGYLNWMLDWHFRRNEWRRVDEAGGNHYWSWRVYAPAGERAFRDGGAGADDASAAAPAE